MMALTQLLTHLLTQLLQSPDCALRGGSPWVLLTWSLLPRARASRGPSGRSLRQRQQQSSPTGTGSGGGLQQGVASPPSPGVIFWMGSRGTLGPRSGVALATHCPPSPGPPPPTAWGEEQGQRLQGGPGQRPLGAGLPWSQGQQGSRGWGWPRAAPTGDWELGKGWPPPPGVPPGPSLRPPGTWGATSAWTRSMSPGGAGPWGGVLRPREGMGLGLGLPPVWGSTRRSWGSAGTPLPCLGGVSPAALGCGARQLMGACGSLRSLRRRRVPWCGQSRTGAGA